MLKTCHAGDGSRESMASDRSEKLNRDLDRMLVQAIERDLLVRIGWGREGDELSLIHISEPTRPY